MSTAYYLVNKKQKSEKDDYEKFLVSLKKNIENKLSEYTESINGELINEDNLEGVYKDKLEKFIMDLKYGIDVDEIRFGNSNINGFTFYKDWTCEGIRDIDSLKEYMEKHPDFIIISDDYEYLTFDEFNKLIKNGSAC